jgi:hypothetical protein
MKPTGSEFPSNFAAVQKPLNGPLRSKFGDRPTDRGCIDFGGISMSLARGGVNDLRSKWDFRKRGGHIDRW